MRSTHLRVGLVAVSLVAAGCLGLVLMSARSQPRSPTWLKPGERYSYCFSEAFRNDYSGDLHSTGGTLWRAGEDWVVESAGQLGIKKEGSDREYLTFRQFGYSDGILAEHVLADPADGSWDYAQGARSLKLHDIGILNVIPMFVPGVSLGVPGGNPVRAIGEEVAELVRCSEVDLEEWEAGAGALIDKAQRYGSDTAVEEAYFVKHVAGRVVTRIKAGLNPEHGLLRVRCFDEKGLFYAIELRGLRQITQAEFESVAQLIIVEESEGFRYRSGSALARDVEVFQDKRLK